MSDEKQGIGSFLEPRPPKLNAWNRLFLKTATSMDVKRNLVHHMGDFEEDEVEETIKVFLRLKPSQDNSENSLEVLSSRILLAKVPQNIINKKKMLKHENCKFTFSHIFKPTVTQKEIFSTCVEKSVDDFVNGQNCLLFSYGTTNAGKTFTVQGNAEQPGIIPRAIAKIFKSIYNKQNKDLHYCPLTTTSVVQLTTNSRNELADLKKRIMNSDPYSCQNELGVSVKSRNTCSSIDSIDDNTYRELEKKLSSEINKIYISDENASFSAWISFAEIYNESIFDLLQPPNEKGKRQQLKLTHDTYKNIYIKGLKHVMVTSAIEAFKVLKYGKNNLHFASTGMNISSSRSHCIFSIKLIKFNSDDPQDMCISSFAICDLAGAERQKNTLNVGDRLKESQSINCSLHVLSRCFNAIRENQNRAEKQRIPFRDSKLTQLFQNALCGKETITMIINVNTSAELFDETQHVLKTSAIARHIVLEIKPKHSHMRLSRFSQLVNNHKRKNETIPWDSLVKTELKESNAALDEITESRESVTNSRQEEMEHLLSLVETLQTKLKAERLKTKELRQKYSTLDTDLRAELTTEFSKMMKTLKDQYENSLQDKEKLQQEIEEERISDIKHRYEEEFKRLKSRLESLNIPTNTTFENNEIVQESEDLKEQIKDLENQVDSLTELVNITKEENTNLVQKVTYLSLKCSAVTTEKEKLENTLEAMKSEGNEKLLLELQKIQKEMGDKIKARDELLELAAEDLKFEKDEKNLLEDELYKVKEEEELNEKKLGEMELELKYLNDLLEAKNDDIDQLQEKINSNESHELISALEEELNSLKARCQQQEKSLEKIAIYQIEMDSQLQEKNDNIKTLESKLQEEIEKSNHFNKLISATEEELNSFKTKYQEQGQKISVQQEEMSSQLQEKIDNIKTLESKLQVITEDYNKLQDQHSKLLNKKCENCELERAKSKDTELLEKDIKEQLKKNAALEKMIEEISNERNLLQKDLKQTLNSTEKERGLSEEMAQKIRSKDQEIESLQSKLTAYEHTATIVKSYREEMEKKDAELNKLRDEIQEKFVAIQTQDQELTSFKSNQALICARYEDQLKKCKEEIEREKREATALNNTLYKSTPTPKKDLQVANEALKQELEAEKQSKSTLLEQISLLQSIISNENEDPNKHHYSKRRVHAKQRIVVSESGLSNSEDDVFHTRSEEKRKLKRGKSEHISTTVKTRGQRLKEKSKLPSIVIDDNTKATQKKSRNRRLFDPSQDNNEAFDSIEMEQYTRQESPGSAIKRNLRSNKNYK